MDAVADAVAPGLRRRADRLSCDLYLPAGTLAIRAEARAFTEVVAPVAHRLNTTPESRDSFSRGLFDAMGQHGIYRIPFPADVGGRGLQYPTLATVTVLEEIAYSPLAPRLRCMTGRLSWSARRWTVLRPTCVRATSRRSCAASWWARSPPASRTPRPTCRRA